MLFIGRPTRPAIGAALALLACLAFTSCGGGHAPSTARASGDPAAGAVIYTSDGERSFAEEWSGYTAASPDRFTRVAFPKAQGAHAWRVDLRDGDPAYVDGNPSYGNFPERAQQNALHPHQVFHEGQVRYISFQVYLPESYPIAEKQRQTIMQIKRGCNGPPIALEATSGSWRLITQADNGCGTSNAVTRGRLAAVRGRWARFTFKVQFSSNPSVGYIEAFADTGDGVWRTLQPLTRTHTMKQSSGVALSLGAMLGYYRPAAQAGNSYIVHDGLTVATTRAAAEGNAFGRYAASLPQPAQTPALGPRRDTVPPRLRVSRRALELRRGMARVRLRCPASEPVLNGTVALRRHGGRRRLGAGGFSCTAGRAVVVRIRLSARSRRLLASQKRPRLEVTVVARDGAGNTGRTTSRVRLRAARS